MPEKAERKVFSEGLAQLDQHITRMAQLSQTAVHKAVDSLIRRDADESREVFALDREVYQFQREIDRECTDLIALHAPVARDLRTIMTTLKITTDIDRIGRGARNIAEVALELDEFPPVSRVKLIKISRSADLAIHMVDQAVRAFVERTDQGVREMGHFDDAVDALHGEIFNDMISSISDGSIRPEVGVRFALVNRHIERIADHAVNIANRVVYLVSGGEQPWPVSIVPPPPPVAIEPLVPPPEAPPPAPGAVPEEPEKKTKGKGS